MAPRRDPIRIATAVARRLSIQFERAELVAHDPNGIVRLLPTDVLARVTHPETLSRTAGSITSALRVAAHAAALGAPATSPTTEVSPGPHLEDGAFVSLWRWTTSGGEWQPREAGRALRRVHEALTTAPAEGLPAYHLEEVRRILDDAAPGDVVSADDLSLLVDELDRLAEFVGALESYQALHGDAHLGNVVWSPNGPVWADWEMACTGVVELDLAGLLLRTRTVGHTPGVDEAIAGYGEFDRELAEQLIPMVALMTTAWMMKVHEVSPTKVPVDALSARFTWWRNQLT